VSPQPEWKSIWPRSAKCSPRKNPPCIM
jgi:hypothetical protein